MSKGRLVIAAVILVTACALLGSLGTHDSSAVQNQLRLLVYDGESFSEFSVDVDAGELLSYFPAGVVTALLNGERVRLSTPSAIAGVEALVDVPATGAFQDVFGLYAEQQLEDTWGCIKCCYSSPPLSCCCKPKEPDD